MHNDSLRLRETRPELPTPTEAQGLYSPVVLHGGFAFVSGQLPRLNNKLQYVGKVGEEIDLLTAMEAARLCARQCLAVLGTAIGSDLDRIVKLVKVTGFIASAPGFNRQPEVMNAASAVFCEILGERGVHARSAVGVAELPHGTPIEIEIVAAVRDN